MSRAERSDQPVPLSRVMPCDRCSHDEHVLRCDAEIVLGVLCRCRDVPVPGIHPLGKDPA